MTQAKAGDLGGFAHALKQAHYYTASEQDYAAGLKALQPAGASGASGASDPSLLQRVPAPGDFSTSAELSRVIDAMSASAVRIADPDPQD
jgi:hypothetical protein